MSFDLTFILPFSLFFLLLYLLFYHFHSPPKARLWLIIIGSLIFYATINYRFIPVIIVSALADFLIALAIDRTSNSDERGRRLRNALLVASVVLNLGILFFFKYRSASLLAPVGISFYIFQSVSYVIDVYRGTVTARTSPLQFFAGVCFFPHLLAGPILRSASLLPQFENLPTPPSLEQSYRFVFLIAVGLIKKGLADLLAVAANTYFSNPTPHLLDAWVGALSFTGQIYGDFSGYTDMAIGFAALMGVALPKNFEFPYTAITPAQYWTRWHITLGAWFKDYFYTPLAMWLMRNRLGGVYVATLATMFFLGLWHGPHSTFAVFGLYHGGLICGSYFLSRHFTSVANPRGLQRALQIAVTFYLVVLGHVIFRASDLHQAAVVLTNLHNFAGFTSSSTAWVKMGFTAVSILLLHFINYAVASERVVPLAETWWRTFAGWAAAGLALMLGFALNGPSSSFIYFQF